MVKEKVPGVVGVPPSAPPGLSVRPAGRAPVLTANVYGPPAPPVAVNDCA